MTAQSEISTEEILRYHDGLLTNSGMQKGFGNYLKSAKQDVSRIEKMEFRTETDRWDVARQEYTVRTSLKSRGETRGEYLILESWENIIGLEHEEAREARIKELYEILIELHTLQQELDVWSQMQDVARDRKRVQLQRLAYDGRLGAAEILKLDDEIIDIDLRVAKSRARAKSLFQSIIVDGKTEWQMDFSDWTDAAGLSGSFYGLTGQGDVPASIKIQEEQLKLKEIDLMKEQAEGDRVLDFLQMKYSANENIVNGNQLSIGMALVIPSGHLNRENIREANIDLYRESAQAARRMVELQKEQLEVISEYQQTAEQWSLIRKAMEAQDLEGTLNKLSETEGVSAWTLLDVKEMLLKRQLDLIEVERDMYELYLDLCELKGKLRSESAYTIMNKNN